MRNIYEIDWRYNSIRRILDTLSDELVGVVSKRDTLFPDNAYELSNDLIGIAFVTAQIYITGTISDAKKITESSIVSKSTLLKEFSVRISDSEVTEIELCDAIANYFKHHDEWTLDWSLTNQNRLTINVLRSVGLDQNSYCPCIKASDILFSHTPSPPSLYLSSLCSMIVEWRKKVIEALDNYR